MKQMNSKHKKELPENVKEYVDSEIDKLKTEVLGRIQKLEGNNEKTGYSLFNRN